MLQMLLDRLKRSSAVVIADELWTATLAAVPFVARLDASERARLRTLAAQLIARKQMASAAGLDLTAEIQVNIAVQASLPVLNLGFDWYRGWSSIVVYPREFMVPRRVTDDDGVVHEYVEPLAGEAWDGGPVILSWEDAQRSASETGSACCVVIHEFVHKIDLLNGVANGVPPFSAKHSHLTFNRWRAGLDDAFERFTAEVELVEAEMPETLDPESDEAQRCYAHLPIDAYAAEDKAEFFAVSSEAFFVQPAPLHQAFPDWYSLLAEFFLQDPLPAS
ncbi:MAG: M90 family metallopeptidase [Burkholderiaceae bacterium]